MRISENIRIEWLILKGSFVIPVAWYLIFCLNYYSSSPLPTGICEWFDCRELCFQPLKTIVIALVLICSVLYLKEHYMLFATFLLFFLCLTILSLDESNGNFSENGIITTIFFAQFVAYLFKRLSLNENIVQNRIQFSLQIIAAVYTLSGIQKLWRSGLAWFTTDVPKFNLEILRLHYCGYAASGEETLMLKGNMIATFVKEHLIITQFILFLALSSELLCGVILIKRKVAFYYGIILTLMHLGIYLVMDIFYPAIMIPMIVFAINPLFFFYKQLSKIYK